MLIAPYLASYTHSLEEQKYLTRRCVAMIQFPGTVEIQFHTTLLKFSIVPIEKNVYAMSNDMSVMKNEDKMTFGYLIHKDGYLYAYGIMPIDSEETQESKDDAEKKYRFDLVFSAYVGPDDITITNEKYIDMLLHVIAISFGNRALYQVRHPSIVQRDRFTRLMDELLLDVQKLQNPDEVQTPYIHTMLETANMLKEFYTTMVTSLEELTSDE